ncbi:MAG: hypothetical protein PHC61_11190 [Chitinivibrionales bacterium]|nr:hypothetical protein [Chitinivibrionales bacterium]
MSIPAANSDDYFISTGLPIPWNRLEHALHPGEGFTDGAQKVGEFFVGLETKLPADDLLNTLIYSGPPAEWFERLLYCMLDIGYPDLLVAKQVLRLRCLRRLFMRIEAGLAIAPEEAEIAQMLRKSTGVAVARDLLSCAYGARQLIGVLARQNAIDDAQRSLLVNLISAEVRALGFRINKLSDSVDVYNLKEMARVLPVIRRFDENKTSAGVLAETIRRGRKLDTPQMTFVAALKGDTLEKWLVSLSRHARLVPLCEVLRLQSVKMVPTRSLVALASLCRWIQEAAGGESSPLRWISQALSIYDQNRFSVDVGNALPALRDSIEQSGAWIDGTVVSGSFSDKLYSQWIGADGLCRPLHKPEEKQTLEPEMEIWQIVKLNISNDPFIARLLDNSVFYMTPGVVEYIALHSRSSMVLSKIASLNYLYAGAGNQNVPAALLKSPVTIPMSLLRQFLKPSFFSPAHLRMLLSAAVSEMRHEVIDEIQAYLARNG